MHQQPSHVDSDRIEPDPTLPALPALIEWIDDPAAPCPDRVLEAMAADSGLRALVRDLRLDRLPGSEDVASESLQARLVALQPPRLLPGSVLGRIGGWSIAAAAAVAVAFVGLHIGSSMAQSRSVAHNWDAGADLAAVGLTGQTDDDDLLALLLPGEESPS
ncbi:MAG: hypothetical protein MK101_06645 [Phycisphaerales bacterium]|nr:hypothetical protein [Phycisphaerales bacterium]